MACAASVLVASADAIYLTWNDCPSSPTATSIETAACPIIQDHALVLAFEMSHSADSVIALEADVDVQVAPDSLPAWWQYAPGGCRYGSMVGSANFAGFSACLDFWGGQANLDGPPVYTVRAPRGGANQARITVSFAVPSSAFRALQSATRYYAARIELRGNGGVCLGCEVPACLVLNAVRLLRLPGSTGDLTIDAVSGNANRVTWQNGTADCSAVPVRRTTWGRLKTLYR